MSTDWRVLISLTVLCWALYNIVLKWVADRVPWTLSMLIFLAGYSVTVALYCALNMKGSSFRGVQAAWVWPLVAGLLCGLGAITYFKAIPLTTGSTLIPLMGLYIVVAAIGCLIFFREPFNLRVVVGILCAGGAVVLLGR